MGVNKFSIKDIETITGIKAHTIRAWESRYNFLKTKRTDTNIRYYDDEDLRFLLNVSALVDHGFKISKIACLSPKELSEKVEELQMVDDNHSSYIKALSDATIYFNESDFHQHWNAAVEKIGFEQAVLKVVYPFLQKMGILWQTGAINPAQEHFATNLIKQNLIVAIATMEVERNQNSKKFLMFLPEHEYHEIALLFAYYLLKAHGHQVLYLGQSLPIKHLKELNRSFEADYVVSILTNNLPEDEIHKTLQQFVQYFKENKVLLTGNAIINHQIKDMENIIPLYEVSDLLGFLNEITFEKTAQNN